MFRPTHASKQFTANRIFTGRQEALKSFIWECSQVDFKNSYKVLMWYGVGGQGKSALLREFQRITADADREMPDRINGPRLVVAKVDFEDERLKRLDTALYSIRSQLAQFPGSSFLAFDTAFAIYIKKSRPNIDLDKVYPELFSGEREVLMDLIDIIDGPLMIAADFASAAVPGANLLYKWGARLTGRLATWWKKRGYDLLAGVEELQSEELLQRLPTYLGADICEMLKKKESVRPIILLDTYEALWRNRGGRDGIADRRVDAWVRLLVQDSPGVLFGICGREKLRWSEIDYKWEEVIEASPLGDLSDVDAEALLLAVPIVESDVRRNIVTSASGLPFYLDLQVSQYESIREAGKEPKAIQFGGSRSDILARFLEHLSETNESTLRLASYLNVITRPTMDRLARQFPNHAINYNFNQMVSRSSFFEVSAGTFEVHTLMKQELQRREEQDWHTHFVAVHRFLHQHYLDQVNTPKAHQDQSSEQATQIVLSEDRLFSFESAYWHLSKAEAESLPVWILKHSESVKYENPWRMFEDLYSHALEKSIQISSDESDQTLFIQNNLAIAVANQGRLTESLRSLQNISEKAAKVFGPSDVKSIFIRHNLGLLLAQKDENHAIEYLQKVQADLVDSFGEENPITASLSGAVARLLQHTGDLQSAEKLFRAAALSAIELVGGNHAHTATTLYELSENLRLQNKKENAEALYRIALDVTADAIFHRKKQKDSALLADIEEQTKGLDHVASRYYTEPLFWKVLFDIYPKLFQETVRSRITDVTDASFKLSEVNLSEVYRTLKSGESNVLAVKRHPNEYHIQAMIRDSLGTTSRGKQYLEVMENHGIQIEVFVSKRLDCRYEFDQNCLVLSMPTEGFSPQPILDLIVMGNLRCAFAKYGGTLPPSEERGLTAYAAYSHALSLEALSELARIIDEWEPERWGIVQTSLVSSAVEFFEAFRLGKSREDLYDIYAVLHSLSTDPIGEVT